MIEVILLLIVSFFAIIFCLSLIALFISGLIRLFRQNKQEPTYQIQNTQTETKENNEETDNDAKESSEADGLMTLEDEEILFPSD